MLKLYRETGEDDTIAGEIRLCAGPAEEADRHIPGADQVYEKLGSRKIINDEIARLKDHFRATAESDRHDRYYYAVLLGSS